MKRIIISAPRQLRFRGESYKPQWGKINIASTLQSLGMVSSISSESTAQEPVAGVAKDAKADALPKLTAAEFRQYNSLAVKMDYFVSLRASLILETQSPQCSLSPSTTTSVRRGRLCPVPAPPTSAHKT